MPPITSFMFIRAFELIAPMPTQRMNPQIGEDYEGVLPQIRNATPLAKLVVISDRFARFLAPNFCVQLQLGLLHTELRFLLQPALRNSLPMAFVFKLQMNIVARLVQRDLTEEEAEAQRKTSSSFSKQLPMPTFETESEGDIVNLCLLMRKSFPHIEELEVVFDNIHQQLLQESTAAGHSLCGVLQALPATLQTLVLDAPHTSIDYINVTACDIDVLAALPHLRQLRLLEGFVLSDDGFAALFRSEKPSAADASIIISFLFFPRLTVLEAQSTRNYIEILEAASKSALMPQLSGEFSLRTAKQNRAFVDVDVSTLPLHCLKGVRVLGDRAFACRLRFINGPLNLEPLRYLHTAGESFFSNADFGHANSGIDLSPMSDLRRVGRAFLAGVHNFNDKIVWPPNLQHIDGGAMLARAEITELDLAPLCSSLVTIDLGGFARGSSLRKFDSTPLRGVRIVGDSTAFADACDNLMELDLTGFVVSKIGKWFCDGCRALKKVTGCSGFHQVEEIDFGFMWGTRSLVEFDGSALQSLRSIGEEFMGGNCPLRSSTLAVLGKIMQRNA